MKLLHLIHTLMTGQLHMTPPPVRHTAMNDEKFSPLLGWLGYSHSPK